MKYKINDSASHRKLLLTDNYENLIKSLEKLVFLPYLCKCFRVMRLILIIFRSSREFIYRKLKYTVAEMSSKIQKQLSRSHERDCASTILDFLRQCGLCGATNHMLKV
jgi:hypothetical protein